MQWLRARCQARPQLFLVRAGRWYLSQFLATNFVCSSQQVWWVNLQQPGQRQGFLGEQGMMVLLSESITKAQWLETTRLSQEIQFVLLLYTISIAPRIKKCVHVFTFLMVATIKQEGQMVQSFVLLVVGSGLSNEVLIHQDGKSMIE